MKKKPKPEFDPALVELLAKAMDGHAFIRYKAGEVLPRGEEMSTPERVNSTQEWRQRDAESRARKALRALTAAGYDLKDSERIAKLDALLGTRSVPPEDQVGQLSGQRRVYLWRRHQGSSPRRDSKQ